MTGLLGRVACWLDLHDWMTVYPPPEPGLLPASAEMRPVRRDPVKALAWLALIGGCVAAWTLIVLTALRVGG